ncbi:ATP-binding protein [Colwelliaceae bacterium 6471]
MLIRRYLVLFLLSVITLITFYSAIQGYKASMNKTSVLFDAELIDLADTLAAISPKGDVNSVSTSSSFAFQIWESKALLLKSDNAPDTAIIKEANLSLINGKLSDINSDNQLFSELNFSGQRWRVYRKLTEDGKRVVVVAQPLQRRFELAEDVIVSAVMPIVLAIPVMMFIVSLVIRQGLKPLTYLTKALMNKKANDLSPIKSNKGQNELTPVIDTLNQLFERLALSFEREKRFASDAAHELRTPLSVLKINVHNLQSEMRDSVSTTPSTQQELLQQLVRGVDRMAHVVDQILTLNRTNPEQISIQSELIDIRAIAQQVISDLYPEITQRDQRISLNSDHMLLKGNEFALKTLLQNLISNASKYTPEGGEIRVSAKADRNHAIITVEDSGPGIASEEYERVFDRFYRVGGDKHNSSVIGCGLGLAIVQHIAQLHGASIELARSVALGGLQVNVKFLISTGGANE